MTQSTYNFGRTGDKQNYTHTEVEPILCHKSYAECSPKVLFFKALV
jgi:hypothetical protein